MTKVVQTNIYKYIYVDHMNANICMNLRGALRDNYEFGLAWSLFTCPKCQDRIQIIYFGWSQLFVCPKTVYRTVSTFLTTGDVKSCCLGRPNGSTTLFSHAEYIIMDCLLQTPQIQLSEIANYITNATSRCCVVYLQAWNNMQEGKH